MRNPLANFIGVFSLVRDDRGFQVNPLCRHDITSPFPPSGNGGYVRNLDVGPRRAGLSILKTSDLLGFSPTTISGVYREWSEKEKISSERQLCGRKCLIDVRGQRRMVRLVRDDRKATVTQITTRYNQGM